MLDGDNVVASYPRPAIYFVFPLSMPDLYPNLDPDGQGPAGR